MNGQYTSSFFNQDRRNNSSLQQNGGAFLRSSTIDRNPSGSNSNFYRNNYSKRYESMNRSRRSTGTFGVKLNMRMIQDYHRTKINSIMFMQEIALSKKSLIHKRCEDYISLIDHPREYLDSVQNELQNSVQQDHFDPSLLEGKRKKNGFSGNASAWGNRGNGIFLVVIV